MHTRQHPNHNLAAGILFMLLATIFFTTTDALGKYLIAKYPIIQVTWIRSVLGIIFILLYVFTSNQVKHLHTSRPGWHLTRSILSTILLPAIFFSIKNIPLAEYVALAFSTPFFIALLSPWFLSEKVSGQSWIAIAIGFIGVLIITRPTPDHFHIAHVTALLSASIFAVLAVTARHLASTETSIALNFYIYPVNVLALSFWIADDWVQPTTTDWFLFGALGLTATVALWCVIQAIQKARPATIAPIDYVRLVWTVAVAYIFWQELPDSITWVGIAVIVASGIYIVTHGRTTPEIKPAVTGKIKK